MAKGYILICTLPSLAIPYTTAIKVAQETGFPTQYIPEPRPVKDAYERATTKVLKGAQGIRFPMPEDVVAAGKAEFGVEPYGRIKLAIVGRRTDAMKNELPIRHIAGEVVIPRAKGITADKQRTERTLATLTLEGNQIQVSYLQENLQKGFPFEKVEGVVQEILAVYDEYKGGAIDHDQIRAQVRRWMYDRFGVLNLSKASVYTIFATDSDTHTQIQALCNFINACAPYCDGDMEAQASVFPIADDEEGRRAFFDLRRPAADMVGKELTELEATLERLEEKGDKRDRRFENSCDTASRQLDHALSAVRVYQESLETAYVEARIHGDMAEAIVAKFQSEVKDEFGGLSARIKSLRARLRTVQGGTDEETTAKPTAHSIELL